MDFIEVTGKTVDDAITEACQKLSVTSDRLYYEIIEKGTSGIFGFAAKPALIKACVAGCENKKDDEEKEEVKEEVKASSVSEENTDSVQESKEEKEVLSPASDPKEFLDKVFKAMNMEVDVKVSTNENEMNIELAGSDMGVLIGKRGQTLDSIQYLTSLVVNKGQKEYIRVKVDTENYRERRKETLENLAKNLAYKAKRTKRPVSLEPMNPYERRIIHASLQNDKYVTTHSEGEEPYRKVVITPVK